MQLTFTAWVELLNTPEEGLMKRTDLVKNTVSIIARHRLHFFLLKRAQNRIYSALNTQKTNKK